MRRGAACAGVFLIVIMWATRAVPEPTQLTDAKMDQKRRIESRIWLAEMYPHYEWPLTGVADRTAILRLDGAILRAPFVAGRRVRLTPLFVNGNLGLALRSPEIEVSLPASIAVARQQLWRPLDAGQGWRGWFASEFAPFIPGGRSRGVNESLLLTAPAPGQYEARYLISARVGDLSVERAGTFQFTLSE